MSANSWPPAWAMTLPHDLQLQLAKWHPKELQTDHEYTCVHTSPAVPAYVANTPEVGRKATSLRTGNETTAFDEPSHWLLLFSSVLSMDGLPKAPNITSLSPGEGWAGEVCIVAAQLSFTIRREGLTMTPHCPPACGILVSL